MAMTKLLVGDYIFAEIGGIPFKHYDVFIADYSFGVTSEAQQRIEKKSDTEEDFRNSHTIIYENTLRLPNGVTKQAFIKSIDNFCDEWEKTNPESVLKRNNCHRFAKELVRKVCKEDLFTQTNQIGLWQMIAGAGITVAGIAIGVSGVMMYR
jgi:anti-sigma-K factor RskA